MTRLAFIFVLALIMLSCNPAEKNIEIYYLENYQNKTYAFRSAELFDTLWSEEVDTIIGYGYIHHFKISSVKSSGQWSPISWLSSYKKDIVDLNLEYKVMRIRDPFSKKRNPRIRK